MVDDASRVPHFSPQRRVGDGVSRMALSVPHPLRRNEWGTHHHTVDEALEASLVSSIGHACHD
jgi:hypothetical protein